MSAPLALSAFNVQLDIQLPYPVRVQAGIDSKSGDFSAQAVAALMDMLTEIADREKLKWKLAEKQELLRTNREMLSTGTFEKQIDTLRNQRAKFDADISQKWLNTSHRGEPKMSGAQKTQMEAFETQILQVEKARADVQTGIPLTLWQIDCLYARIAGQAEPPMPEEVAAVLTRIEMPEDVGFTPQLVA